MGPGDPPGKQRMQRGMWYPERGCIPLFVFISHSFADETRNPPPPGAGRPPGCIRGAGGRCANIFPSNAAFFGCTWGREGPPGRQRSGETGMKEIRMRRRLDFYNRTRSDGAGRAGPFCRKRMQFYTEESAGPPEADFPQLRLKIVSFRPKQRQYFVQADGVVTYRILLEK